jgi:hypothetical protein
VLGARCLKARAFGRKRPSNFLSLAREKVTKERGTPCSRPTDILSSGFACAGGIFRWCIHAPAKNVAHPARRPAGLSAAARRSAGAPFQAAHPCAFEPAPCSPIRLRCIPQLVLANHQELPCERYPRSRAHGCAASNGAPAQRRAGAVNPQGGAQEARRFSLAHGCAIEKFRRRTRTRRTGCPEGAELGVPFLLVTFRWASNEK